MGSARARPSPSPAWPSARPSTGRYKNLRPRRPTCQGRARRRYGRFGNRAGGLRLLAVLPGQELRRDQPQIRQGTFRKHLCKCKRAGDRDQDAPGGAGGVGARGAHPEAAQHCLVTAMTLHKIRIFLTFWLHIFWQICCREKQMIYIFLNILSASLAYNQKLLY